jgi:hypothetical protein
MPNEELSKNRRRASAPAEKTAGILSYFEDFFEDVSRYEPFFDSS